MPTPALKPAMAGVIILALVPGSVDTGASAEALAMQVLANALSSLEHQASQAWQVAQLFANLPLIFALTPVPGQWVTNYQIRELVHALRQQAQVQNAWPTFAVCQEE